MVLRISLGRVEMGCGVVLRLRGFPWLMVRWIALCLSLRQYRTAASENHTHDIEEGMISHS